MGASYLSRPVKTTCSVSKSNHKLTYGASSMQGWRMSQEDAHNCILDYDDDIAFFAVYDGHGGSEVAIYTSEELPKFLKNNEKYQSGLYEKALIETFLGFDDTIPSREVLQKLKEIADNEKKNSKNLKRWKGYHEDDENDEDDEEEEEEFEFESAEVLRREANRPIDEVVASYKLGLSPCGSADGAGCGSSFSGGSRSGFVDSEDGSSDVSSATGSSNSTSDVGGTSSAECLTSAVNSKACNVGSSRSSRSSLAATSSTKSCKNETLSNGSVSEEHVVNGVLSNGDIDDEPKEETLPKRIPKEPVTTSNNQPGTSPTKKKNLALSDLEDATVVRNFIFKDEISESDEDDSDDETFEITNDDEEGDNDSRHLQWKHGIIVEDSEEGDDEDDGESGENDEDASESKSGEDDDDEEESDATGDINSFTNLDEQPGFESGCTAVVALIKGDNLYVANAGDSRCVICKSGVAVDMSEDHKPEDHAEWARVVKAGGRVSGGRIQDCLNLSRAIGDHKYKKNTSLPNTEQMITALPDVKVAKLEPDVEFIVLACDGIWNSLSSQEVVSFIGEKLKSNRSLSAICEDLFNECLAPKPNLLEGTGCDNMTCIIVKPLHNSDGGTPSKKTSAAASDTQSQTELSENVDDAPTKPAEQSGTAPGHQVVGNRETSSAVGKGVKRFNNSSDDAENIAHKRSKTGDVILPDVSSCPKTTAV